MVALFIDKDINNVKLCYLAHAQNGIQCSLTAAKYTKKLLVHIVYILLYILFIVYGDNLSDLRSTDKLGKNMKTFSGLAFTKLSSMALKIEVQKGLNTSEEII